MIETTECDGLTITVDDETGILTFNWNEKTHPQWDFLYVLGEDGIKKRLIDNCKQILSEDETENLHNPVSSS